MAAERQRGQDAEGALTARFTHQLHEQSLRLAALEAEKARLEAFISSDLKESQQVARALQGELERRLKELTDALGEKHVLSNDKAALGARVGELERLLARKTEEDDAAVVSKVRVRPAWTAS